MDAGGRVVSGTETEESGVAVIIKARFLPLVEMTKKFGNDETIFVIPSGATTA